MQRGEARRQEAADVIEGGGGVEVRTGTALNFDQANEVKFT